MRIHYHENIPNRFLSLLLTLASFGFVYLRLRFSALTPDEEEVYQENSEDGDITIADPTLHNGMTWTSHGSIGIGTVKGYEGNVFENWMLSIYSFRSGVLTNQHILFLPSSLRTTPPPG